MRLIDVDAFKAEHRMADMCGDCERTKRELDCNVCDCCDWLDNAPTVDQWISVKDRLPEQAGCYLAYRHCFWAWDRGQITVCYWDGIDWFDDYVDAKGCELSEDSLSHWMLLPKLPEEVKWK